MPDFDLVIRGGTVVDGTGAQQFEADVAIRQGIICQVGKVSGSGREEIDARGKLVTPGYVDVHTHYDGQVSWENRLVPSTNHGVTTAVMGNCGVGFAPCREEDRELLIKLMEGVEDIPNIVLREGVKWQWETYPEFLQFLSTRSLDADICSYMPHAALRTYVMGERAFNREPATADEIAQMSSILEEALEAGAFGFGTSQTMFHRSSDGQFTPTLAASFEEYAGLAAALGRTGKGVMQFVIEYGDRWEEITDMAIRLAGENRCPVTMTLVQSHGMPDIWRTALEKVTAANEKGIRASVQVLPRPLGVLLGLELTLNPFYATPTYRKLLELPLAERVAEMRREEVKNTILQEVNEPTPNMPMGSRVRNFDQLFEISVPVNYEPLPESSIGAQAKRMGVSPQSMVYDKLLEHDGRNILYLAFSNYADYSLESTRQMLLSPYSVPGLGDGGAHLGVICDGSIYTYMLTHWARDRTRGPKIDLAYLVHSMTKRGADVMGLADRGVIAPGLRADINVIDFENLALGLPYVVRDLPAGGRRLMQDASGYDATIVAGVIVSRHGEHTGALPGRLVRGARDIPNFVAAAE